MHKVVVSQDEVKKIAKLASLKLVDNEAELFAGQFTDTVDVINELNEIDTSAVPATYQVNNLSNITRNDEVDEKRVLSQEVAIREAKQTHEGYFVVPRVIDADVSEEII